MLYDGKWSNVEAMENFKETEFPDVPNFTPPARWLYFSNHMFESRCILASMCEKFKVSLLSQMD